MVPALKSYRQAAAERYAVASRPAAPSEPVRTRLYVLRSELELAVDERDAARVTLILAEGLHEGHFLGFTYRVRRPLIWVDVEVDGPPWRIRYETTMRDARTR